MNPNSTIIWENDQSYVTLTHEIYSYNLYLVYGDKKIDQIIAFEDGKYLITASLPGDKPVFKNLGADFFGKTMYHHCKKVLDFLDGFSDYEILGL
ncbi:MAG: hypothetical protein HY036_02115 [Nitrospirae bacterium]|nr:hypothetical protein [Nitrospirota bacterium]